MNMCENIAAIKEWLGTFEQTMGLARAVCEVGEEYQEFIAYALCRPGDEKVAESVVASLMKRQLAKYFNGREGMIYWRIPLEFDISDHSVVELFDVNGPDIDFETNRRCIMDKNWKRVAVYCRLFKAKLAVLENHQVADGQTSERAA